MNFRTRRISSISIATALILAMCGCSRSGVSVVPRPTGSNATSGAAAASDPGWSVPDRFASAIGKRLNDKAIDSYIDASVVGRDRDLARKIMKMMPPNRRGDFVLYDGARVLSNNAALIPLTKIIEHPVVSKIIAGMRRTASSAVRRPRGDSGCAPRFTRGQVHTCVKLEPADSQEPG